MSCTMSADRSAKPVLPPAVPAAVPDSPVTDDRDSDCDHDDDYVYRPLSNLPTPPLSSRYSTPLPSPRLEEAGEMFGPAVHLVNMLPPAASLATPSVALVQAMLLRTALPLDTIALAVCILDALDVRFSRLWRRTCPLAGDEPEPDTADAPEKRRPEKRHTLPLFGQASSSYLFSPSASSSTTASPTTPTTPSLAFLPRPRHIDAIFPEIIILAALVIAAKFTDDGCSGQQAAHAYCGSDDSAASPPLWTPAQLAATERCIMQSLGYRILPLLDADLLADARADMRRAGAQARQQEERRLRQQQRLQEQAERRCHVASRSDCFGLFR